MVFPVFIYECESWTIKKSVLSHFSHVRRFRPHGLWPAPLSMEFSRQDYWSGLPFLLQGIFPTRVSNPGLLNCGQTLYRLSHQGIPMDMRVGS